MKLLFAGWIIVNRPSKYSVNVDSSGLMRLFFASVKLKKDPSQCVENMLRDNMDDVAPARIRQDA